MSEKKALELAKALEADENIVHIGVCLMDLKLGQAIKEGKVKEHVKMSVDASKEFLEKFDLSEEEKKKIMNCVEAHHGTIPFICKEAEICANADCYRFIHPKGVFEFMSVLSKRLDDKDERLNQLEAKLEEKHNTLSLGMCKKELEEYYQMFKKLIADARKL